MNKQSCCNFAVLCCRGEKGRDGICFTIQRRGGDIRGHRRVGGKAASVQANDTRTDAGGTSEHTLQLHDCAALTAMKRRMKVRE